LFGGIADCAFREEESNWILADMTYSYGRACTVASSGTPLHTTNRLVIVILCKLLMPPFVGRN
jgi:hypothetical protein